MDHELTLAPAHLISREAFLATEQVIRNHSKTFFFATALLPARARRAIRSLYAFCRSSDDLVDCTTTTRADLDAWRAEVSLPSSHQRNPVLYTWALVREEYEINRRYESELLAGIEMDLSFRPFHTWGDLRHYCYLVASTVGLLSLPVIGTAQGVTFEHATPYAIELGIALQLTNILRDIGEDARRGRVYLPEEDLTRFGLTTGDILNGVFDERFIALMNFEMERARELYLSAMPGIAMLNPAVRPAVGAAAFFSRAILDEIERLHYHVYTCRAHTSGLQKIAMLPGILYQVFKLCNNSKR